MVKPFGVKPQRLDLKGPVYQTELELLTIYINIFYKKSRIRETKHLSTDADSSTDTTVGWTKNSRKPNFLEKGKNHPKRKNSKRSRDMPILTIYPLTRGL